MGLFHKQHSNNSSDDEALELEQHFFDENFREELRNHGRLFFEKVIKENGGIFKQDLDATLSEVSADLKDRVVKQLDTSIAQVNAELKEYATKQLDERFASYGKEMKDAQDATLQSLSRSAQTMQDQQQLLNATLQKSVAAQEAMLNQASQENIARLTSMKNAQDLGLQSLTRTTEALEEQYKELSTTLKKSIETQEEMLITAFQENMAQIIEHYLLGALGEQYDLKAQLPSIIEQMEANKQAIVDDMRV